MNIELLNQHFPNLHFNHFSKIEDTYEAIVKCNFIGNNIGFENLKDGNLLAYICPDEESNIQQIFENTTSGRLEAIQWVKQQFKAMIEQLQRELTLD